MQARAKDEDSSLGARSATHDIRDRLAILEDYRPLLELGRGGMARVYLAEKRTRGLRRLVVLKVLDRELSEHAEMRNLFRREAEICARLNHPNIVQVFEVFEDTSCPVIVMEYVEGVSLWKLLGRGDRAVPLRLQVHVLLQVLAALQYFHELRDDELALSAVHRDVSPQNVLVMHEGAVKVLDFGIAKVHQPRHEATRAGIVKGKLNYMPPEQLLGDASIDRRADLFAVGVMLWEAFARRRLWQGVKQEDVARRLLAGDIPRIREVCPAISTGWESVITRALAARREDRFSSALEMQLAIEAELPSLGPVVQQRELAAYMQAEFGEARRKRQRQIEDELKQPPIRLAALLGEVSASGLVEVDKLQETPVNQAESWQPSPRRRRLLPLFLLLLVTAAAAIAIVTALEQPELVGPMRGTTPSTVTPLATPTPAPDTAQVIEEPPVETTAPAVAPSAARKPGRAPRAARVQRAVPEPAPAVVSAAPRPHCNPPYVLDREGVKTFKPECL